METTEVNGLNSLIDSSNKIATLMLADAKQIRSITSKDIISDLDFQLKLLDANLSQAIANATWLKKSTVHACTDIITGWAANIPCDKLRICLSSNAFYGIAAAAYNAAKVVANKKWYFRISNSNLANDMSFYLDNNHDNVLSNVQIRVHIESGDELYLGCFKHLTYSNSDSSISEAVFFPGDGEDATLKPLYYKFDTNQ